MPDKAAPNWGGQYLLLAAILATLNILALWPGVLNSDSQTQLAQAHSGLYADWHPPVMAWVWSGVLHVVDGPAGMLCLQVAMHWLGLGLMADGLGRTGRTRLAWCVVALGAFPSFLFYNGLITKDVAMSGALLCAFAIVFRQRIQGQPVPLWQAGLALLLLAYGTLLRTNAVFALGPLALYLWGGSVANLGVPWRAAAAVAIAAVALVASNFINHRLLQAQPSGAIQSLALFDLYGVARHAEAGLEVLPPEIRPTAAQLDFCYTPYWWDPWSYWGDCKSNWDQLGPADSPRRAALPSQWLSVVRAHPAAWLTHRLKAFNSGTYFMVPLKHCRFVPGCDVDKVTRQHPPATTKELALDLVKKNPLTWPALWLVVAAFLTFAGKQMTDGAARTAVWGLSGSALFYMGTWLVVSVATDNRYAYWPVLAAMLALALYLGDRPPVPWRQDPILKYGLMASVAVIGLGLLTRLSNFTTFVL